MKIVVSRYNENVEWTKQFQNVVIYNKGNTLGNDYTNEILLNNVGREGHTYYKHIYDNYDTLDEYTIFLQANPYNHSPDVINQINNYKNNELTLDFEYLSTWIIKCNLDKCIWHKTDLPLLDVYNHLFDEPQDSNFEYEFGAGAQFIVSKKQILKRSRNFYLKIVHLLQYDIHPIEGYVIERFHKLIFTTPYSTIITNIFNEEYLLPFWLDYHKRIFDHGIIIDYDSTDKSIEIIKTICPTWEIRRTKNLVDGRVLFETYRIEEECKEIEISVKYGYKIYLNTTEWLILNKPLHEILNFNITNKCYLLNVYLPLYENDDNFYPTNTQDFISNFNHKIVSAKEIRGYRFIFNRDYGNYAVGRHFTNISSDYPTDLSSYKSLSDIGMCVFWCGYYPINELLWTRKLNVKTNMNINIEIMPELGRNTARQHFYSIEDMKTEYNEYLNKDNRVDEFYDVIDYCKTLVMK